MRPLAPASREGANTVPVGGVQAGLFLHFCVSRDGDPQDGFDVSVGYTYIYRRSSSTWIVSLSSSSRKTSSILVIHYIPFFTFFLSTYSDIGNWLTIHSYIHTFIQFLFQLFIHTHSFYPTFIQSLFFSVFGIV